MSARVMHAAQATRRGPGAGLDEQVERVVPVMVINGKRYIEKAPPPEAAQRTGFGSCGHCALMGQGRGCLTAIEIASIDVFGGDCFVRDVIYVELEDLPS